MKNIRLLFALPLLILTLASGRAETTNAIPRELRKGNFACDNATIGTALEIKLAGWTYIMPAPKSPQAAWGNRDGRTTWWIGYWINKQDNSTSAAQPKKESKSETITGDGKGLKSWQRGGSPAVPTKVEWLCSDFGGIEPRD